MDIYTENGGVIKTKWNGEFIKNVGIFSKGELFNRRVSEASDEWIVSRGGSVGAETVL